MELVGCPLCGFDTSGKLWSRDGAEYVRCSRCSLIYENPRFTAEELKSFYSRESYFVNKRDTSPAGYSDYFSQCTGALLREYFDIVMCSVPGRTAVRFLDIGCGPGGLVELALAQGWEASGLELSSWAANIGKEKGLPIIEGTLESIRFPESHFDVISLFDVLEHLPNPREPVREIHRILKPGGVVIVETPNIGGLFARTVYRERSDLVKPRAHICLYTPATARRLFAGAGFAPVKVTTFPYCRKYTPGYCKSLAFTLMGIGKAHTQATVNESMRIVAIK